VQKRIACAVRQIAGAVTVAGSGAQATATVNPKLAGLADALVAAGVPGRVTRVGSMGTAFFLDGDVVDYASVKQADTPRFGRFHAAMLERGVYLPPSQFEAWFLSTQHDDAIVQQVIAAAQDALAARATA